MQKAHYRKRVYACFRTFASFSDLQRLAWPQFCNQLLTAPQSSPERLKQFAGNIACSLSHWYSDPAGMRLRGWYLRCLVLVQYACQFHCIKVTFWSNRTLKVALKQTLVLEASVSEGTVTDDSWDIRRGDTRNRLFPPGMDPRISGERQGNKLKLTVKDVRKEDFGTYIVTVAGEDGSDGSASKNVEESEEAPAVSIRLLCEASHDPNYDQWDVPKFEWLVDGKEVQSTSDKLSPDGRTLNILDTSGYNYTCRVSSSLGTRDTQYNTGREQSSPEPKIPDCNSCTVPWVLMSVAVLGCAVLGFLYCREKRQTKQPPRPEMEMQPAAAAAAPLIQDSAGRTRGPLQAERAEIELQEPIPADPPVN
ncbi:hypothetical protein GJAV_G00002670 [Gymnothorax javanicus]|nr:hypothetical protein GJAV_G00002670 [Gymnothorax javanicus]